MTNAPDPTVAWSQDASAERSLVDRIVGGDREAFAAPRVSPLSAGNGRHGWPTCIAPADSQELGRAVRWLCRAAERRRRGSLAAGRGSAALQRAANLSELGPEPRPRAECVLRTLRGAIHLVLDEERKTQRLGRAAAPGEGRSLADRYAARPDLLGAGARSLRAGELPGRLKYLQSIDWCHDCTFGF